MACYTLDVKPHEPIDAEVKHFRATGVDTCDLLKLRKMMINNDVDEMTLFDCTGMREKLLPLRAEFLSLPHRSFTHMKIETTAHNDSIVSIFRRVWKEFSALRPENRLYIPPIVENDEVIEHFCFSAHLRERALDVQEAHGSGHIIINGLEGTGKTTLLKAFAIAVAVLGQNFFAAFVDYRVLPHTTTPHTTTPHTTTPHTTTPHSIMSELNLRVTMECYDGTFGILPASLEEGLEHMAKLNVPQIIAEMQEYTWLKCYIGIIGDEIQQSIIENAANDSKHVELACELHEFARYTVGSLLVLSASTADLSVRLFAYCRRKGFQAYPSFKGYLCNFYEAHAARSIEQLQKYITARYPKEAVHLCDDTLLHQLLHVTGGIGSLIHAHVTGEGEITRVSHDNMQLVADLIRRYQASLHGKHSRLERFIEGFKDGKHSKSEKFIEAIEDGMHETVLYLTPADVTMPYVFAAEHLKVHTTVNPDDLLEDLFEKGLLYMVNIGPRVYTSVQLARPADATHYYSATRA